MLNTIIYSITTFNRSSIAIRSIDELFSIIKTPSTIIINDDGSTEVELISYINKLRYNSYHKVISLNLGKEHYGIDRNNMHRCSILAADHLDNFVYLADDDMEYSTSFFTQLMKCMK
jgi:GT2 family glycosyltransferase